MSPCEQPPYRVSAAERKERIDMKTTDLNTLKEKICGKTIVSVEPSKWPGEVKSFAHNHDSVSIKFDDGTTLEIGNVLPP